MADLFSFNDIMGLGGYPNAPPADLGQPYAGGGGLTGLLGSQRMIGLGLGLMQPAGQSMAGAMKGYQTGAGEDLKAQAIARQAQQNAMSNQLARDRMAQQESQFTRSLEAQNKPRAQIQFKPGGWDEEGNQTYKAYIFQPDAQGNFTGREIPIEQAQALQQAGVPAAGAPAPPPGPETPQQFTDSPESTNVEDRRDQPYFQNPQVTAPPGTPPNVLEQLKRMGVKGPGIQPALKSYGTHAGAAAADAAAGKMTEQQSKDIGFATRMETAQAELGPQGDLQGASIAGRVGERLPDEIRGYYQSTIGGGESYQKYAAAKSAFITAFLRKESGAAITSAEWERYNAEFFPQPGEPQSVIEQKRRLREATTNVMKQSAGMSYRSPDAVLAKAREAAKPIQPNADTSSAPAASTPQKASAGTPARPRGVPSGSQYSPSRNQWRDSSGHLFEADGTPVK
jgi:hypothetical protein